MKKDKPVKKDNGKEAIREILINPRLPTMWVDWLEPSIRADGIALIRLVTNLPEGAIEQAKFTTNENNLKEFINTLCKTLDYYPSKAVI